MKTIILEKIEKIKKKPEYIRKRYAIISTAIVMFFVLIVWAISIKVQTNLSDRNILNQEQQDAVNKLGDQKKSLEDATSGMKDVINQMPKPTEESQGMNSMEKELEGSKEGFNR